MGTRYGHQPILQKRTQWLNITLIWQKKRLRDRQVLKLLDLYEYGLYSDVEADDFKKQPSKPITKYQATQIVEILKHKEGYDKEKVKAIFQKLTHEEAKDVLEHFHTGRIDEAVSSFYKLGE